MRDIWAFALQTLSASVAAIALLGLKALFRRRFSPRWQYGVWTVLALALVLPARGGGMLFPTLALRLETLKTAVESGLASAYSTPWDVTRVDFPIPLPPAQAPASLTDWLFVLHLAGAVSFLLLYAVSYLRLRVSLRRAVPAGPQQIAQIDRVCTQYGLRPCARTVISPRAQSAFVCGLVRPVLVLPAGAVDDKVLLHELLHRRCGDVAVGFALCALRCLHWCNPLIRFALRRVQADCETLCDQRVLERLEGEERRDYGRILLSMADRRPLWAPGTSSIANGGRCIRERIESIARFRLYPRDMRLASGCVALVALLACTGFVQTPLSAWNDHEAAVSVGERMTFARLHRAGTAQDAFFLYAAALERADGCILARVTPLSRHGELAARLAESGGMIPVDDPPSGACALYAFRADSARASALLVFEDGHCYSLRADNGPDGWTVDCLDRWTQTIEAFGFYSSGDFPALKTYSARSERFYAEVSAQLLIVAGSSDFASSGEADDSVLLDPTLAECGLAERTVRTGAGLRFRWDGAESAEISGVLRPYTGDPPDVLPAPTLSGESIGSSSDGSMSFSGVFKPGELHNLGGGGNSGPLDGSWQPPLLPDGYILSVYCGGKLLDTVLLLPGGAS